MHPMKQVGEWPSMMGEWVRAVGKGLLACVVVGVPLPHEDGEVPGVALPDHHMG